MLALINEQTNNNYSLKLQIDIILIISDIFLGETICKGWYERKECYLTNRIRIRIYCKLIVKTIVVFGLLL